MPRLLSARRASTATTPVWLISTRRIRARPTPSGRSWRGGSSKNAARIAGGGGTRRRAGETDPDGQLGAGIESATLAGAVDAKAGPIGLGDRDAADRQRLVSRVRGSEGPHAGAAPDELIAELQAGKAEGQNRALGGN